MTFATMAKVAIAGTLNAIGTAAGFFCAAVSTKYQNYSSNRINFV